MESPREASLSLVIAVVPDLFFAAKLQATARAANAALALVPAAQALERCAATPPLRLLLDLHAPGALGLARALKADARTARIPIVGFYSHVETELRVEALAAGVDEALPRSAFVHRLPALLVDDAPPQSP
jgi:CheY-like chemotaxis protein